MFRSARLLITLCLLTLLSCAVRAAEPAFEAAPTSVGIPGRPGDWNVVRARVSNPTNETINPLVLVSFNSQHGVQFGASVTVPPQSTREALVTVKVPDALPNEKDRSWALSTLLVQSTDSGEKRLAGEPATMLADDSPSTLAVMRDGEDGDDSADLAIGVRKAVTGAIRLISLRPSRLPHVAAGWDSVDALVLAHAHLDIDPAQIQALRQWLVSGGRLWVMLDRCDPAQIEQLLGEDWTLRVVSTSQTLRGSILSIGPGASGSGSSSSDFATVTPVPLVRVVAPGFETLHTVDGWPVSLSRVVGRGAIFVTTLGPQAWMDSKKLPSKVMIEEFGTPFLRTSRKLSVPRETLEPLVTGQIGRRIVSRRAVSVLLGVPCALMLLGAGWALVRGRGRAEPVALMGLTLSLVTTAAVFGVGLAQRGNIPLSVCSAEVGLIDAGQRSDLSVGLISVYNPSSNSDPGDLTGRDGVVWPAFERSVGRPARLIWSQGNHWKWTNLNIPSGAVLQGSMRSWSEADPSMRGVATLEENRVRITVPSDGPSLRDAMVVSSVGSNWISGDGFDVAQPFSFGEFASSAMMSDELRQKQSIASTLWPKGMGRRPSIAGQPALLVWTKPDRSVTLAAPDVERRGISLSLVPLEVRAPPAGGRMTIPPILLPFQTVRNRSGSASSLYDPVTRQWLGQQQIPATVALRFDLPASLLPLKIDSARLRLNITARGRSVGVGSTARAAQNNTVQSPSGVNVFELRGSDLTLEGASIPIMLIVGDEPNAAPWAIKSLDLSLTATSLPR